MLTFVTSITDKRGFYEFVGIFRKHLVNIYGKEHKLVLNYVTERSEEDPIVTKVAKFCDVLNIYKPMPDIDDGNYAKVLRLIKASELEGENTIVLMDVDILMLNPDFFNEKYYSNIEDKIGTIGKNIYKGTKDEHKFPMSYAFGRSNSFKQIVNPENKSIEELIYDWNSHKLFYDGKEFIGNDHGKFSDESLFYLLQSNAGKEGDVIHFDRPDVNRPYGVSRRIDRVNWSYDIEKIKQNYYLDCVPMRPFGEKYSIMKEVFDLVTNANSEEYKI